MVPSNPEAEAHTPSVTTLKSIQTPFSAELRPLGPQWQGMAMRGSQAGGPQSVLERCGPGLRQPLPGVQKTQPPDPDPLCRFQVPGSQAVVGSEARTSSAYPPRAALRMDIGLNLSPLWGSGQKEEEYKGSSGGGTSRWHWGPRGDSRGSETSVAPAVAQSCPFLQVFPSHGAPMSPVPLLSPSSHLISFPSFFLSSFSLSPSLCVFPTPLSLSHCPLLPVTPPVLLATASVPVTFLLLVSCSFCVPQTSRTLLSLLSPRPSLHRHRDGQRASWTVAASGSKAFLCLEFAPFHFGCTRLSREAQGGDAF
ncbi:uncharacterized protein LOC109117617 [Fukomys damarensis]|uniref:uncharacterized protein LOC109117617 n=1 Tax=Fukomys damarensis TaxID=885580 RepID=UPI0014553F5C|nr:uncharacterized protein LOC109117617 [Fukomys damarensis]XP_033623537.1 uncharacterized protein LOC109117617 [Fukomys damarensis]